MRHLDGVDGLVLAGGKSRRFGRDKRRAVLGDGTFDGADDLRVACGDVTALANVMVEIEETIYGEIETKTQTGFISGTLPDLLYGHHRWLLFSAAPHELHAVGRQASQ